MFVLFEERVVGRFLFGFNLSTVVCLWMKRVLDDQTVTINGASRRRPGCASPRIFIYKHTHGRIHLYIFLLVLPPLASFSSSGKTTLLHTSGQPCAHAQPPNRQIQSK
jgi:hypothetical protein